MPVVGGLTTYEQGAVLFVLHGRLPTESRETCKLQYEIFILSQEYKVQTSCQLFLYTVANHCRIYLGYIFFFLCCVVEAFVIKSCAVVELVSCGGAVHLFVARCHAEQGVAFLVFVAHVECTFVQWYGFGILFGHEKTLCRHVIIYGTLMRGERFQLRYGLIEAFAGVEVVCFVEIAHSHVCLEARIKAVAFVQLSEKQDCFVIFSALKILQCHSQPVLVAYFRRRTGEPRQQHDDASCEQGYARFLQIMYCCPVF